MKKSKIEFVEELSIDEQVERFVEIIIDIYFQQLEEQKKISNFSDRIIITPDPY
ncbi:MAG: hypothetical protein IM591_12985 [Chitinophagaceae bacterium]|nr:hypothetical protein [Chitinophagaceae bacterium]